MKNNSLFLLASSLNRKEMTRFAEFAASPYFNKHKQVRALAGLLSEIYPDFSGNRCERHAIFQKLYPGQPHDQPQLAIIFSYTVRLMEQFLIVESLGEVGQLDDKTLFFNQLRKRKLDSLLKTDWEDGQPKSSKRTGKSSIDEPLSQFFFEKKIRTIVEQDAIAMRLGQTDNQYLAEKQRLLDTYYLTERLRDACELLQRARLLKSMPEEGLVFNSLIAALNGQPEIATQNPSVNVYLQLYNLLKNNDLRSYPACLQTVKDSAFYFNREELQNIYNYLQNFCIQQINQGQPDFLKEVFKLYQHQLDNNLLLVDGLLPEWHYKNIVTTGLRLDEREWVRIFIEQNSKLLAPAVASNAYSFNMAALHYHIGQPQQVLPLLLQVEYTDLRYNLDAKSLLLRTYFDLQEEEALLAHADAFGQFVKRNKSLTDFQKRGYFNLIKFSKQAFKLKMQMGFVKEEKWQEGMLKLQSDIKTAEIVFNRTWLEAKIEELAHGH